MPGIVYLLSAGTSLACGVLLWRAWRYSPTVRLLLWSALCFFGLAIDNILLYADLIVFPQVEMYNAPSIAGLVSVTLLLFGLIWDGT
jgi:hypothetical protein